MKRLTLTKTDMKLVYLPARLGPRGPKTVENLGMIQWRAGKSTLFAPWNDLTFSIADLEKILTMMKEGQ